jgi:glycine cleavage system H protein
MVALFVILTIVVCVMADSVVQWAKAKKEGAQAPDRLVPAYAFEDVSAPAGVFLDPGHTWLHLTHSGTAHVGVDGFAQKVMGRIDGVELPAVGDEVRRGDKLFAIRQGDRTAVFNAPIDGVVKAVDEALARHPEAINADPYAMGWICSLSPKNLAANLKRLRVAEEAKSWLKSEVERFQEFFAARPLENMALGQVLQDGGQPTGGVLELMDDETWNLFAEQFLRADDAEM